MLVLRFPYAKERLRFANLAVHGILWRLEPGAITMSRLANEKAAGALLLATFVNIVAVHTGQSSQLFHLPTGRNAQFLATVPTLVGRLASTSTCKSPSIRTTK